MGDIPSAVREWSAFKERVELWHSYIKKLGEVPDKRENAVRFAIEVLGADPKTADKFVYRNIEWHIIKSFESHGKDVECKICGQKDKGGYWCSPCIHHDWCCECCILLGNPGYSTGVYSLSRYKCPRCGEEFVSWKGEGYTELGVGIVLAKRWKPKCPKCGKEK